MKRLTTALFVLLLAYSPLAFCENWQCVEYKGEPYCFDIDSIKDEGIKDDGVYRTVKIKNVLPEGTKIEGMDASEIRCLLSFNCSDSTASFISAAVYDKDNQILEGTETKLTPHYFPVSSDAMFVYERVCSK